MEDLRTGHLVYNLGTKTPGLVVCAHTSGDTVSVFELLGVAGVTITWKRSDLVRAHDLVDLLTMMMKYPKMGARSDEFVFRRKQDGRTLEIVTKEDTDMYTNEFWNRMADCMEKAKHPLEELDAGSVVTPSDIVAIASWGRCKGCDHLTVLHCHHCCEECQVDGCECDYVEM